jgi:hypothetical protein
VSALAAARKAAGLSRSSITATVLEEDVNQLMALYPRTQLPSRLLDLVGAGGCNLVVCKPCLGVGA